MYLQALNDQIEAAADDYERYINENWGEQAENIMEKLEDAFFHDIGAELAICAAIEDESLREGDYPSEEIAILANAQQRYVETVMDRIRLRPGFFRALVRVEPDLLSISIRRIR